nr:2'-5' RNA ligase family protein [Sphaerochaetaceae bacterium]
VDGFGSFGERTLFANIVGDRKWEELRDMVFKAVNEEIPGVLRKDRKPFRPHISISNRDIPQGAVYEALRVFSSIQMKFDFEVDGITVFERSSSGLWLC